jgi:hypothetical protein
LALSFTFKGSIALRVAKYNVSADLVLVDQVEELIVGEFAERVEHEVPGGRKRGDATFL